MRVSVYLEVEADSVSSGVQRVLVACGEEDIDVVEVNAHEASSYEDGPTPVTQVFNNTVTKDELFTVQGEPKTGGKRLSPVSLT